MLGHGSIGRAGRVSAWSHLTGSRPLREDQWEEMQGPIANVYANSYINAKRVRLCVASPHGDPIPTGLPLPSQTTDSRGVTSGQKKSVPGLGTPLSRFCVNLGGSVALFLAFLGRGSLLLRFLPLVIRERLGRGALVDLFALGGLT